MADIETSSHTHHKRQRREGKATGRSAQTFIPQSVGHAIGEARRIYQFAGFATHDRINEAEDWINSSPNVGREALETATKAGHLKRSPTSGRLFIQLAL